MCMILAKTIRASIVLEHFIIVRNKQKIRIVMENILIVLIVLGKDWTCSGISLGIMTG